MRRRTDALDELVERLVEDHDGAVTAEVARDAMTRAWEAVGYFGATHDADMLQLAHRIADRDLRLRLGLDREAARLDPENHTNRGVHVSD
jgi:hypothetical protein